MNKKYGYILFDLDGTLIDTTDLIVRCFEYSLSLYDVKKTRLEISSLIGLPLLAQFEIYFKEKNFSVDDYQQAAKKHMEYQLQIWQEEIKLFPKVKETLAMLKEKNIPLAIVTSRKVNTTSLYTKYLNIDSFFTTMITPEDTLKHKPNEEPTLKAMSKLNAVPEKTLFIGDSIFDLQSSQKAGVDNYLVCWKKDELYEKVDFFSQKYNIKAKYNEENLDLLLNQLV